MLNLFGLKFRGWICDKFVHGEKGVKKGNGVSSTNKANEAQRLLRLRAVDKKPISNIVHLSLVS